MKIVLQAFGNKLSGMMEVPEETGREFRLAMTQPIQFFNEKYPMMSKPLTKIAVFEWTGKIFSEEGHNWDGAKSYQLTRFQD